MRTVLSLVRPIPQWAPHVFEILLLFLFLVNTIPFPSLSHNRLAKPFSFSLITFQKTFHFVSFSLHSPSPLRLSACEIPVDDQQRRWCSLKKIRRKSRGNGAHWERRQEFFVKKLRWTDNYSYVKSVTKKSMARIYNFPATNNEQAPNLPDTQPWTTAPATATATDSAHSSWVVVWPLGSPYPQH